MISRLEDDPLPLALTDKKHGKREIINVADDWNDVGISMISEIIEMSEVSIRKSLLSPFY